MSMSYIADSVAWHYNSKIKDEGNLTYIYSGTIPLNSYNEAIPDTMNYTGSYLDRVLFTPLNPKERQFLPEGTRNDDLLNAFFTTGSTLANGTQLKISGTTTTFEIIQLTQFQFAGNVRPYQKATVRSL